MLLIVIFWWIYMLLIISTHWYLFSVTGKTPQSKQGTTERGIWSCSICTYDNDESFSACDICGVLRNPLIIAGTNRDKQTGIQLFLVIIHIILLSGNSASEWIDLYWYLKSHGTFLYHPCFLENLNVCVLPKIKQNFVSRLSCRQFVSILVRTLF